MTKINQTNIFLVNLFKYNFIVIDLARIIYNINHNFKTDTQNILLNQILDLMTKHLREYENDDMIIYISHFAYLNNILYDILLRDLIYNI